MAYSGLMKHRIGRCAAAIVVLFAATSLLATPAHASGPQVDWDCELIRLQDSTGTFVYFDPRATATWSGNKLKFNMWSWASRDVRKSQAGKIIGTATGSSGWNSADLDLSTKFYYGAESEYKKVVLKLTDSRKRSRKYTCIWKGPVAAGR